jgi:hypothetical protein
MRSLPESACRRVIDAELSKQQLGTQGGNGI